MIKTVIIRNKGRILKVFILIKHYVSLGLKHTFNSTVRRQLKDFKCIPIIIISYNQLYYLKQLVDFLLDKEYKNIIIIDNHSTYRPLLNYFKTIETSVTIHRLEENYGHLVYWKNKELYKKYSKGYYVITDPDIVPVSECPEDFLLTFRKLLDKAYDRTKVGFSLKLYDIPTTNPNKKEIVEWESQYWKTEIMPNVYKAPIDTTFALYRSNYSYKLKNFTKAWRTDYPLQARHGGWYVDINNLTDEQEFYIKTANDSASWKINVKGELVNKLHKSLYTND